MLEADVYFGYQNLDNKNDSFNPCDGCRDDTEVYIWTRTKGV